jgi:NADPH2:quinone reductase
MLAAFYDRVGPARDVLTVGELPTPRPGPGEVRVAIACSGVNPSDVKTRGGVRSRTLPFAQIIPHSDGAGVIDAVGDGVPRARVGERVWVWNAAWGRPYGTAAQYVALPARQAVLLPENTGFEAGACLGIPALTACHAVLCNGGVAGKTVLVQGGAGAVGHYAIQFARLSGARLIVATVSSDSKAALARGAGADVTIDYKNEDVVRRCIELTEGVGVDRIVELDLAANLQTDLAALRKHDGEITVYGSGAAEIPIPFFPAIVANVRLQFFIVYNLSDADRRRALDEVNRHLGDGKLQHNIAARLPLARTAEAHELVESGRVAGNVVLDIPEG